MKIITVKGGLGNQMFQYAYGRRLELSGKKVVFDTSFFEGNKAGKDTARAFKLKNFNIETKAEFSNKKHWFQKLKGKIKRKLGFAQEGLYQNERYFLDIKDTIQKEFTLKNTPGDESKTWKEKIENSPLSVSIHIRRGDYIENKKTNNFHGVCDLAYYAKALERMEKKIGDKIEIFVFSDDIIWAKENLKFPHPLNFVSDSKIPDYEEMYLMSLCKHNIIANSSFSWWGAWLNQNPNKIVVAPRQWLKDKTADKLDILPDNWIKI